MLEQLLLPLSYLTDYSYSAFRPLNYCKKAFDWIAIWPNVSFSSAVIAGEKGVGKTHLSFLWHEKSKSHWVKKEDILENLLNKKAYSIDDVENFIGIKEKEEVLFHLYNHAKLNQKPLLITAQRPIVEFDFFYKDLKSRLLEIPAFFLENPSQEELEILLIKQCHDIGLDLDKDIVLYLFNYIERTALDVNGAIAKLSKALGGKKILTKTLIETVFLTKYS
ncbi:MAG TPA: DnaA/Hda family protein [Alphaproteobacteria bacterium]|nr:DnaA/Hda family protein [Alphaproteobacteria bacterium]